MSLKSAYEAVNGNKMNITNILFIDFWKNVI